LCVFVCEQPGEKGSPEGEREAERERNHASLAQHLHTHMGMSYNLMAGQYDIYQGTHSLTSRLKKQEPNADITAQTNI